MEYKEFIDGINDSKIIKQIDFYIQGYNHYRKCSIGRYIEKINKLTIFLHSIGWCKKILKWARDKVVIINVKYF